MPALMRGAICAVSAREFARIGGRLQHARDFGDVRLDPALLGGRDRIALEHVERARDRADLVLASATLRFDGMIAFGELGHLVGDAPYRLCDEARGHPQREDADQHAEREHAEDDRAREGGALLQRLVAGVEEFMLVFGRFVEQPDDLAEFGVRRGQVEDAGIEGFLREIRRADPGGVGLDGGIGRPFDPLREQVARLAQPRLLRGVVDGQRDHFVEVLARFVEIALVLPGELFLARHVEVADEEIGLLQVAHHVGNLDDHLARMDAPLARLGLGPHRLQDRHDGEQEGEQDRAEGEQQLGLDFSIAEPTARMLIGHG
jgi:hypothetical protein